MGRGRKRGGREVQEPAPQKKDRKTGTSSWSLLQAILRTKFELDDFYDTDSVESEVVSTIFNNMNKFFHKNLYPKGMRYPCGETNRLMTLHSFPHSSTSSDRQFFSKKINEFINGNHSECKKLLENEMEKRKHCFTGIENTQLDTEVTTLMPEIEKYNSKHREQIGKKKKRRKEQTLSPIFTQALSELDEIEPVRGVCETAPPGQWKVGVHYLKKKW